MPTTGNTEILPSPEFGEVVNYRAQVTGYEDGFGAYVKIRPPFNAPDNFFTRTILFVDDDMQYITHITTDTYTMVEMCLGTKADASLERYFEAARSILDELSMIEGL